MTYRERLMEAWDVAVDKGQPQHMAAIAGLLRDLDREEQQAAGKGKAMADVAGLRQG